MRKSKIKMYKEPFEARLSLATVLLLFLTFFIFDIFLGNEYVPEVFPEIWVKIVFYIIGMLIFPALVYAVFSEYVLFDLKNDTLIIVNTSNALIKKKSILSLDGVIGFDAESGAEGNKAIFKVILRGVGRELEICYTKHSRETKLTIKKQMRRYRRYAEKFNEMLYLRNENINTVTHR